MKGVLNISYKIWKTIFCFYGKTKKEYNTCYGKGKILQQRKNWLGHRVENGKITAAAAKIEYIILDWTKHKLYKDHKPMDCICSQWIIWWTNQLEQDKIFKTRNCKTNNKEKESISRTVFHSRIGLTQSVRLI